MVGMNKKKKIFWLCIFLFPNLIGMMMFSFLPIASSLVISLTEWDLIGEMNFIGIQNYTRLFNDSNFHRVFLNTLQYIIGYIPLVIIFGLGASLLLNKKMKFRAGFRAIYFFPVITSWVAVSFVWMWLFNPSYGLLNYLLSLVGMEGIGWLSDPSTAMISVIIASVWKDVGFVMVLFLGGLQSISPSLYEASSIDGAGKLRQLWSITIPQLAPTTFMVTTILLINSFQVFTQVMIMTEGGPGGSTRVVVQNIYDYAFRFFEMGYAAAMSWILFLVIFIITAIRMRLEKEV